MSENPSLPQSVAETLAKRVHRMHQYMFDELRAYWLTYTEDARDKIRALGWEPPRPAADENQKEIVGNNSGEDYLYLHCQMLAFANSLLADAGDPDFPRVEGWVTIPRPDDPHYPIPPPFFLPEGWPISNSFIVRSKSDDFYERRITYWQRLCTDPAYLRGITLDELGTLIESNLHDTIRTRWATSPAAHRPDPPNPDEPIEDGWDDPQYDYLRDMYSMHMNPIYWKFFGWVQDRVEDWKLANGVFGRAFWTATWVGKLPEGTQLSNRCPSGTRDTPVFAVFEDAEVATQHVAEMEEVLNIIAKSQADEA